jgi:1,4-dihydroxy-6-naphthoate synthase
VKDAANRVLRSSVEYAFTHPQASLPFVREHAQEMSEEVMYRHIDLYVNDYSVDLGPEGRRAVELLFERGRAGGTVPAARENLFLAPR